MKKLLLYLFFVLLSFSLVTATGTSWHFWEMEGDATDKSGLADLTEKNSVNYVSSTFGMALETNSSTEGLCFDDDATSYFDIDADDDFSLCFFYSRQVWDASNVDIMGHRSTTAGWWAGIGSTSSEWLFGGVLSSGTDYYDSIDFNAALETADLNSYCIVYDNSANNMTVFWKGSESTNDGVVSKGDASHNDPFVIGGIRMDTSDCSGNIVSSDADPWLIDQVLFYNDKITTAQILEYNETGTICSIVGCATAGQVILDLSVNLSQNSIFNYTDLQSGILSYGFSGVVNNTQDIFNCSSSIMYQPQQINLSSYEIIVGDLDGGVLSNLNENDGTYLTIGETVGSPPSDVRFNFSNVNYFSNLYVNAQYTGNPAHVVSFYIFNHTNNLWSYYDELESGIDETFNITIDNGYLRDGEVHLLFNHSSSGVATHYVEFDAIYLENGYNINNTYTNVNITVLQEGSFDVSALQNWTDYSLWCENNNVTDSIQLDLFIDLIEPFLTITSDFINNSIYSDTEGVEDSQLISFLASDPNLIAYNRSIWDYTNVVEVNISQLWVNGLNSSSYLDSFNFDLDYGTSKNFRIEVEAWDSHTGENLKKKESIIGNTLWYGDLAFYCDDIEELSYKKEKDRIKPIVKFKTKKDNDCYYIVPNIQKVPNSDYPNHYYSIDAGIWIDDYEAEIEQIEVNKLHVKIKNKKEYLGESFGDLNYVQEFYYFNISYASLSAREIIAYEDMADSLEDINQTLFIGLLILFALGLTYLGFIITTKGNIYLGISLAFAAIPTHLYVWTYFENNSLVAVGSTFLVISIATFGILLSKVSK